MKGAMLGASATAARTEFQERTVLEQKLCLKLFLREIKRICLAGSCSECHEVVSFDFHLAVSDLVEHSELDHNYVIWTPA